MPTRLDVVLVRVLIECVFVKVIIESETCRIYEVILQTIKADIHNLPVALNFIA
jgi:hypothetical protein